MNRNARRVLLPLLAFGFFIAAWQLITQGFAIPAYLLPSPSAIGLLHHTGCAGGCRG